MNMPNKKVSVKEYDGILTLIADETIPHTELMCGVPESVFVTVENNAYVVFKAVVLSQFHEDVWNLLTDGQQEISETLAVLLGAIPSLRKHI